MQIREARDLGRVSLEPQSAVDPHLAAIALDIARLGAQLELRAVFPDGQELVIPVSALDDEADDAAQQG